MPDPDGSGPQTSPVTQFGYDSVDNQTAMTDARTHVWQTRYDAVNRVISGITPSGLTTNTVYRIKDAPDPGGTYKNDVTVTDPSGVAALTNLDVLGRKTSDKTGTLIPATYNYDVVGDVTSMTDPAGITVQTLTMGSA